VLLASTRPRSTVELPLVLGEPGGPGGTVRLVGPAAGGTWPAASRWAAVLFGPSGLYAAARASPRSLRVTTTDVAVGRRRRVSLGSGVTVRSVTAPRRRALSRPSRVERGGASAVLLGAAPVEPVPALAALVQGADLLVAAVPPGDAGRGLAALVSGGGVASSGS
jgi:hypothetical protein